jgi:hypothetical protein
MISEDDFTCFLNIDKGDQEVNKTVNGNRIMHDLLMDMAHGESNFLKMAWIS